MKTKVMNGIQNTDHAELNSNPKKYFKLIFISFANKKHCT